MQSESTASIEDFCYPPSGLRLHSTWQDMTSIDSGEEDKPVSLVTFSESASNESPAVSAAVEESIGTFEEGHRQGLEEGRRAEQLEQAARLLQIEKERIGEAARLFEQFACRNERVLRSVETEVVKLAVAIASRILRREAEVDPLLLTGTVRVALAQLADKTGVRIRVPASDASLWSETIAHLPNLRIKPVVVPDAALKPGECLLESEMGSADVGVESQLCEINRNFFGHAGVPLQRGTASESDYPEVEA